MAVLAFDDTIDAMNIRGANAAGLLHQAQTHEAASMSCR
jgi:hypothetical protein